MSILKIKKKIKKIIKPDFLFRYKGIKKSELLIFDDIFPHPLSGFRTEEFTALLDFFKNSKIVMNPSAYPVVNTPKNEHKKHVEEYKRRHFLLSNKLRFQERFININTKLFYCIFINNIYINLSWLEKYKIPFVFTLYPGGGFQLNETESDYKLKKVFQSPMFRKIIVTQKITYDYLVDNKLCDSDKIKFVFGGVVPQVSLNSDFNLKKSYLSNKPSFDICFCAAKYTPKGEDKGYDVFIEFAKIISTQYDFINFHVIGGFNENDIDVTKIKQRIKFYGYQNFEALSEIYKNMDILVSPNKAFKIGKGGFDGFPLGTVVEAALNGVAVLITDELNQNYVFKSNEDLIIIDSNPESIVNHTIDLIENPEKLYSIARKGKEKFSEIYSNEIQMNYRIAVLQNEIVK